MSEDSLYKLTCEVCGSKNDDVACHSIHSENVVLCNKCAHKLNECLPEPKQQEPGRRNNPGNIRSEGRDYWLGQTGSKYGFCVFRDETLGIRALYCLLDTYYKVHRLSTVRAIITRYAPPAENDTEAYIKFICRILDVTPSQTLTPWTDPHYFMGMAIARYESGADYKIDPAIYAASRAMALMKHKADFRLHSWKTRDVLAKIGGAIVA